MILYFENQRQINDFRDFHSVGRESSDLHFRLRYKSGCLHYLECLVQVTVGKKIAIVYPRQPLIAQLFIYLKNVFFIEDGLNSVRTKSSQREMLLQRWFGFRFKALYFGYNPSASQVKQLRKRFGYNEKCHHVSQGRKRLVIILNNRATKDVINALSALDEIISVHDEVIIFRHPAANQILVKEELLKLLKNKFDIDTSRVLFKTTQYLHPSITLSNFVISFRSAVILDFWLSCSRQQQENFTHKILGLRQ